MTHRKHAAALLTAVLLLALTACGRQTAAASDPAQTPAAPAVETPVITAPAAAPTPAAGKDAVVRQHPVDPVHPFPQIPAAALDYQALGIRHLPKGIRCDFLNIHNCISPHVGVDSSVNTASSGVRSRNRG